jgi:type II secretory pathway pseudopilin PulG
VELLVVIAIIGILVALLLPAVQSAREAARRTQCRNNLKQLALATLSYHQAHDIFPPAMTFPPAAGYYGGTNPNFGANWVILILPYLEQQPLYDSFNLTLPINDAVNSAARGTPLSVMLCPADTGRDILCSRSGGNWARGNYGASGNLLELNNSDGATSLYWGQEKWARGVMGSGTALRIAAIRDGTSNTLLLTEVKIGLADIDYRGTWAMSAPGASCIWGVSLWDGHGPNECAIQADNLDNWTAVISTVGAGRLQQECMYPGQSHRNQAFPRSRHVGGVLVALADGSVHFVSDYIEKCSGTATATNLRAWERLVSSSDGMPFDAGALQ